MILTVTINPLVEQRFTYRKISFKIQNRNGKLKLAAGGKGINVSRQLNKLNIQNIALTFAGGKYGKLFRDLISKEGIAFSLINTNSETRIGSVIIDSEKSKLSYFFGENQVVTPETTVKIISKMEKMIQNCEIVIFSGSSPCKETDIIFPAGINLAAKYDKISICDTYGDHLADCYSAAPKIVHNNVDEVTKSLRVKLENEVDKINYLNDLYSKGVKQVFLTNGENKTYASNFDFHYSVTVPKINTLDPTGSGDAFVAGIAYGWNKKITFVEQIKFASALGSINAKTSDVCNVSWEEANKLIETIEVKSVGKKIKILNDTPN